MKLSKLSLEFEVKVQEAQDLVFILFETEKRLATPIRRIVRRIRFVENHWAAIRKLADPESLVMESETLQAREVLTHYSEARASDAGAMVDFVSSDSAHDGDADRTAAVDEGDKAYRYNTHKVEPPRGRSCWGCDARDHLYNSCTHPDREKNTTEKLRLLKARVQEGE